MMEKAGTGLVQARKNHPKGLSMPLWPTTMRFERLLPKSVTVMRARIRVKVDHNVTSFKFIEKGELCFGLADDHPKSNTAIFRGWDTFECL